MLNLFGHSDMFTLTGSHVNRVQQVLRVAQYQIALAQDEVTDYRMEDALVEVGAAIAAARGLVADAIESLGGEGSLR
jgi:hypothetical protein